MIPAKFYQRMHFEVDELLSQFLCALFLSELSNKVMKYVYPTSVKFSLSQSYLEAVNNYKPLQLNLVSELHL